MAKLAEEVKLFIVQRLAMFDTPTQVAEAVKEEFGIEVHRSHVACYDADRSPKPAQKWCAISEATRAKFLETLADIPIAQRSYRLRSLQRMATLAESSRNYSLAAQLLEQAAKEVGEVYTNKRTFGISGEIKGGVLAVPVPLSAEEWGLVAAAQQSALIGKAKEAAVLALKPGVTN